MPEKNISEIKNALKKLKRNRTPGQDSIVIEAIQIGGRMLMKIIENPFNLYLHQSKIPVKGNNAVPVLLHNKEDVIDLENFRLMSLLNHLYKLFTRILSSRFGNKLDFYQPRE